MLITLWVKKVTLTTSLMPLLIPFFNNLLTCPDIEGSEASDDEPDEAVGGVSDPVSEVKNGTVDIDGALHRTVPDVSRLDISRSPSLIKGVHFH